ncbi:MAG: hypothetical protein WD607_09845 [Candidatus Paceibacterota bacterium]
MSDIDSPKIIDVAISFLSQDEDKAKELSDVLNERLDVFYYAERQPELVATDGEESFGTVFRDKARVVVVFYRKGWGETVMTRAERSGIKQRAIKEGYNFSIWVPLDDDKSIPAFLDPQFIWFDYDRWGINGLSAVIEEKVKESGQKVRPETAIDRLSKFKRKAELNKKISEFQWSEEGVKFVLNAQNNIESFIKTKIKQFEEITNEIRFGYKSTNRDEYIVTTHPYRMIFYFFHKASNTIHEDEIIVDLLKGKTKRTYHDNVWSKVRTYKFLPTLDLDFNPAWKNDNGNYFSLNNLVNHMLEVLADEAIKEAERNLGNS